MKTPAFWYDAASPVADFLSPFSIIWQKVSAWQRSRAHPSANPIPVICVGNAVAGGAGKTPTTLALAALLQQQGRKLAIVTRGYGGVITAPTLVDRTIHTSRDVGDEALLLAAAAPTFVARKRAEGIAAAAAANFDLVLMDDGLQHTAVKADYNLMVVDSRTGFGNGRIIPAGPLREPLADLFPRLHGALVIGTRDVALPANLPQFRAHIEPHIPENLAGKAVVAFAGLANPEKFFETCRGAGLQVATTAPFPDHYHFAVSDLMRLEKLATQHQAQLVTTEKDYVRLAPFWQAKVEKISITLKIENAAALLAAIEGKINA